MTLAAYPPVLVLPRPLADGYGLTSTPATIRTDMDNGTPRVRRRFTRTLTAGQLTFNFRADQYALFDGWWRSVLIDGSAWFQIQLRNGLEDTIWTVRGAAVPEASLQGMDVWHVVWKIEIEDIPRLGAADVAAIAAAGFPAFAGALSTLYRFVNIEYPAAAASSTGP